MALKWVLAFSAQQGKTFYFIAWARALPKFRPALRCGGVVRLLHQTVAAAWIIGLQIPIAVLRPSDAAAVVLFIYADALMAFAELMAQFRIKR